MRTKYLSVLLLVSVWLFACANYQVGGYVQSGIQALLAGNNETALTYFETAAQQDPNYVYAGLTNEGVLNYLGRAQYLTGKYAQARQTLGKALARNKTDNVTRLYLGLAQARLGDTQAGLKNIEGSMKGINGWLNYLNEFWQGEGWDPGGVIQSNIKNALAMISSGNITWPRLYYYGESVGLAVEKQQETFRQLSIDAT